VFVRRAAILIYLNLHRYPEAEAQARAAATLNDTDPEAGVLLIRGIADPARRPSAVRGVETSPANGGPWRDAIVRAMFLMQLGEPDRALAVLDEAAPGSTIPQLLWFPVFDPVRGDPRFKLALQKMGLPYTPKVARLP
jgi:hypothetical protein